MKSPKLLFILKRREDFDPHKHTVSGMQTGLFNSASFVSNMLNAEGIDAMMELAIDANCIDKFVVKHKPTHVIIEALWATPAKLTELCQLHPTVKWIVRLHSETPFLSQEGMAFDWIGDYVTHPNVVVAANAPRMKSECELYISNIRGSRTPHVAYLPNYYPHLCKTKHPITNKDHIDIGCFGAVRPLKNHVVQAFAALKFANMVNKKLHFHINARIETKGDAVLRNLMSIFEHTYKEGHQLVFHEWVPRRDFLDICAQMDIGMQVSFSETFNIVGADLLSQGVPIIGSHELPWIHHDYQADPTSHEDIARVLVNTYCNPQTNVNMNKMLLSQYTDETRSIWLDYFTK